jgi:CAAX protease family protein
MSDQAIKNPLIKQGWLRVILFGCGFIIITLLVAIPAVLIIAGVKMEDLETDLVGTMSRQLTGNFLWLMLLLEFVIALLSVWLFRVFVDRKTISSLGLEPAGYQSEQLTGFFMGPALLGASALLLLVSGHLQWTDIIFNGQSLMISLGMMVLIAFSEELVFRGYILGNLLESPLIGSSANKWVALTISSVLFAAFHLTNPGMDSLAFVNILLAGILLGINYIYTKNLWFSLLLHLSWNFVQGPVLGFRVSGLTLPSLLQAETKGDSLLTGGEFGLEGSIMTTALLITAILILAWAFERKYASPVQTGTQDYKPQSPAA